MEGEERLDLLHRTSRKNDLADGFARLRFVLKLLDVRGR